MKIIWMSFGPIGDTLLSLAFFDDLLHLAPDTKFTVLTSTNAQTIRELSSAYPSITVRPVPGLAGIGPFLLSLWKEKALVIVPGVARRYSAKLKIFFWLLSLRPGNRVIGFRDSSGPGGWLPFEKVYSYNFSTPIIENYRKLVPDIFQGKHAEKVAPRVRLQLHEPRDFAFKGNNYFVIHMFGTRPRYSFPPKRWHVLLEDFRRRFPGYEIVLTGSNKDRELIETVARGVRGTQVLIDAPILEVAWIVKHAAVYVGVDTGISHLAAVLGQKSVIIGHNTDPMWLPSYNPQGVILTNNTRCLCRGDKSGDCVQEEDGKSYRRCTYDVTIDDVAKAVSEKLKTGNR